MTVDFVIGWLPDGPTVVRVHSSSSIHAGFAKNGQFFSDFVASCPEQQALSRGFAFDYFSADVAIQRFFGQGIAFDRGDDQVWAWGNGIPLRRHRKGTLAQIA